MFTHPPCCSLSGSVFVSSTSGACVCARVYVCTERPVTAEEENCICGGNSMDAERSGDPEGGLMVPLLPAQR